MPFLERMKAVAWGTYARLSPTRDNKGPRPVSFQPAADTVTWHYGRPQSSDVLTHSQGYQTKVTSLIDGGQIFHTVDQLLTQAKKSVLVDMYEIQHPVLQANRSSPSGTPGADKQQQIVEQLIALQKKGVKVKVILDNSTDRRQQTNHNQKVLDYLRANGVETLAYPRNGAKINHVKLLIVDNQFAVLGGMNWGNHSPVNHDACVLLEGNDVGNLAAKIFNIDYGFSGGNKRTLPRAKPIPEEKIKILATSTCASPDGGQNGIYTEILRRIDGAQKSILCELFVLTDKTIAEKLVAAHKRLKQNNQPGVQVIVDPGLYLRFQNCRPMVDYLKAQGVPIRFYRVDWAKEEKLHAKWGVFDEEEIVIGSANWSKAGLQSGCPSDIGYSSPQQFLKSNHEASLAITSKALCTAFVKQFNFDWRQKSMPIQTPAALYESIPPEVRRDLAITLEPEDMRPPSFTPPSTEDNPFQKKPDPVPFV